MTQAACEVNFDGLVGPTHHYGGLSWGNLASQRHRRQVSHPRQAALEGLAKMKRLADLGVEQAVLPPAPRPDLGLLRGAGFGGSDAQVVQRAQREAPVLLSACYSAASMWAANAATVCPSADAADGRVHVTAANLVAQLHRASEAQSTAAVLRRVLPDSELFVHHAPLPATMALRDEGAANHTRLSLEHGLPGLQLFAYGVAATDPGAAGPTRFPARQTMEASAAVARLHGLDERRVVLAQMAPQAIDAGAFHADVVMVGNTNVLLFHAQAFAEEGLIDQLRRRFARVCGGELRPIVVRANQVPLDVAVRTYLFNSQLISLPPNTSGGGGMALICPTECQREPVVRHFLESLLAGDGHPIRSVQFVNLRQSMRNGGGPACLRLRMVLTRRELAAVHPGVRLTPGLYQRLVAWVGERYRERLSFGDLADPSLIRESYEALDELTGILELGNVYEFQR